MSTRVQIVSKAKPLLKAGLALMLAAGVAACSNTSRETTGSIAPAASGRAIEQMSTRELQGVAQRLGQSYAKQPNDKATALRYAAVLQMSGSTDQALAVMRKSAIDHPKDRDVLAAYGKALAADGQFEPALQAVRRAQTPEYPDWRLVSAEAAILDQLGQNAEARNLYTRALELKPGEPSVLSNLGMSYVLTGDLKIAEATMRKAVSAPGADSRVRQNLALVVGLQGRFAEAEAIASQELSPDQAKANVAYLRGMLAQQNAWNDLEKEDKARRTN
ncbi:tetratricopeptide repeat protein [Tianweitania sp. BSSL-BM11]|uniref:Tetratricopeptide repeat protein n=1 Tax=Tianweitania aestuarii TaxID=2814886 RepID=A0ABS5RQH7_9HYPH|nr:tetratricopeptide repeat protein [Tianweitania aestuarii]MBS9719261.1 tetratricopeptide repeat protein [Tianweitania aestuarii]